MFRFTIRDIAIAMALTGVSLAWFIDHRRQSSALRESNWQRDAIIWVLKQEDFDLQITREQVSIWRSKDKLIHWKISRTGNYPQIEPLVIED